MLGASAKCSVRFPFADEGENGVLSDNELLEIAPEILKREHPSRRLKQYKWSLLWHRISSRRSCAPDPHKIFRSVSAFPLEAGFPIEQLSTFNLGQPVNTKFKISRVKRIRETSSFVSSRSKADPARIADKTRPRRNASLVTSTSMELSERLWIPSQTTRSLTSTGNTWRSRLSPCRPVRPRT